MNIRKAMKKNGYAVNASKKSNSIDEILFARYSKVYDDILAYMRNHKQGGFFEYRFSEKALQVKSIIPISEDARDGYMNLIDALIYIAKKAVKFSPELQGFTLEWQASGVLIRKSTLQELAKVRDYERVINTDKTVCPRKGYIA